jgi:hypothetical protein
MKVVVGSPRLHLDTGLAWGSADAFILTFNADRTACRLVAKPTDPSTR